MKVSDSEERASLLMPDTNYVVAEFYSRGVRILRPGSVMIMHLIQQLLFHLKQEIRDKQNKTFFFVLYQRT
jgi:hypothetical protein